MKAVQGRGKRHSHPRKHILIRNLDIELLFGLAEGRPVQLGGHFNQVIAAEEKVSFTSRFRALQGQSRRQTVTVRDSSGGNACRRGCTSV